MMLILVWNLWTAGPGSHGDWDLAISRAATEAVSHTRARDPRVSHVACVIYDSPDAGEEVCRCRAGRSAGRALSNVLAVSPDAPVLTVLR